MSIELYSDKGKGLSALANNLKLAIAAKVYGHKLSEQPEQPSLQLDIKDKLQLIEANSIVKYLANDFAHSKEIDFEEDVLFPAVKQQKKLTTTIPFELSDKITPSSIILFASAFALDRSVFPQFAQLPQVAHGISEAIANTSLERPKPVNEGKSNVVQGFQVDVQEGEILPDPSRKNNLITSALPYVNNVPHLGNIIGSVLSADIFSRYSKARNYNTLFICGTDEYGTATETKALEEGVTPRELCTKYHAIHADIYKWFQIDFDYFGRTTTQKQTEIAQDIYLKLEKNGLLEEKSVDQLYCPEHKGFLADRFVEGTCPKCQYEDARGDQCDKCGILLNPMELINPRCKLDNATPVQRVSEHVFLSLDQLQQRVEDWYKDASSKGEWSRNSNTITESWFKKGLDPRCITRDLKWGTPVPNEKFADKVLYVWFDACIGYVSITANYTDKWESWWKDPEHVSLYQFMGKDNVPFHTVVFPSSQLGTEENWTMLHHLNTTEYLQYEGGKFSKSRGVGVFGNNAKDSGISPSVWRYYLASVRPETSDSQFSWDDFQSRNNNELLANLGNFVNRIVKFVNAKYNGVIPKYNPELISNYAGLKTDLNTIIKKYVDEMEAVHERKGLEVAMSLSARGNQFLQENKLDNSLYNNNPELSDAVVGVALNLVYFVGSLISPYMPETTQKINEMLRAPLLSIQNEFSLILQEGHCVDKAQYLFTRIDDASVQEWRGKYGGQQK